MRTAFPVTSFEQEHDPKYHIFVTSHLDPLTGQTTGLLARLSRVHLATELIVGNALSRDVMSADPRILLESTQDKGIHDYVSAVNSATTAYTGTRPGMPIAGDIRMDGREEAYERMYLHGEVSFYLFFVYNIARTSSETWKSAPNVK